MKLVKDPVWAKLRISFNGQWKARPEWCCSQLKNIWVQYQVQQITDLELLWIILVEVDLVEVG